MPRGCPSGAPARSPELRLRGLDEEQALGCFKPSHGGPLSSAREPFVSARHQLGESAEMPWMQAICQFSSRNMRMSSNARWCGRPAARTRRSSRGLWASLPATPSAPWMLVAIVRVGGARAELDVEFHIVPTRIAHSRRRC
jgi:hypothetical protein